MVNFTTLFWLGTIAFLISSMLLVFQGKLKGDLLFYSQVSGGLLMFVGSKIGRTFLGFE